MQISAFIGYDSRFPMAYAVTVRSLIEKNKFRVSCNTIIVTGLDCKEDV